MAKISELKEGMNNVSVEGKISSVTAPKDVVTKFGTSTQVANATLEDETGSILLVLWGNQIGKVQEGATVTIEGGYVKSFRGTMQLGVGRTGKIEPKA